MEALDHSSTLIPECLLVVHDIGTLFIQQAWDVDSSSVLMIQVITKAMI